MNNNKLFCIIGPSGSGKDYIVDRVVWKLDEKIDVPIDKVVTHTTRPKRNGELDGKTYHFHTQNEFINIMVDRKDDILEYKTYTVYNTLGKEEKWTYFILKSDIDLSKSSYLFAATPKQYYECKQAFGKDKVNAILILTSDKDRLLHAIERESHNDNPNYTELCRRFISDKKDFGKEELAKYDLYEEPDDGPDSCDELLNELVYKFYPNGICRYDYHYSSNDIDTISSTILFDIIN